MTEYEKWLQRWHRAITIGVAIAGVFALCALTAIGTAVWIGANRPYEQAAPEVKGNVACWFDADGLTLTCFRQSEKFTCVKR